MKSIKKFGCQECLAKGSVREFSRAALFRQHQLKVHAERCLKCRHCPKTFSVSYLLRQHESQCNLTLSCEDCGAKFKHRSSLRRHLKIAKHGEPQSMKYEAKSGGMFLNVMAVHILPIISVGKDVVPEAIPDTKAKPVTANSTTKTTKTYRAIRPKDSSIQNVPASKESISVQTTADISLLPGPSIATQTVTNQCNVAVGIDDVFDDLEKLFAQAETQTQCQSYEQNFQNAETQTYQPMFTDSDIQTKFDRFNEFLPLSSYSLPSVTQVTRALGSLEGQTSFERQMQHFGMQTMFPQDSKIAETQTLSISSFDGQSQTGMELSSVETQTIEEFLNELQNTP